MASLSTDPTDMMRLSICIVGADTLIGSAILTQLLHGPFNLTFKSITALVSNPQNIHQLIHTDSTFPLQPSSLLRSDLQQPDLLQESHSSIDPLRPKIQVLLIKDILDSPDSYIGLFQTLDGVCIIPPVVPDPLAVCQSIFDLCQEARVNNVILLGPIHPESVSVTSSPRLFMYRCIEHALKSSKIQGHCILRYEFIQQYLACWTTQILEHGVLPLPITDGLFAPIHISDIVSTVIAVYVDRSSYGPSMCPLHRSSLLTLTGPELLSGHHIANEFTKWISSETTAATLTTPSKPMSSHTRPTGSVAFQCNSHNEARRYLLEKQLAVDALCVDFDAMVEMLDAIRHEADVRREVAKRRLSAGEMCHVIDSESHVGSSNSVSPAVWVLTGRHPKSLGAHIGEWVHAKTPGFLMFKSGMR
ncbi:hypothetical protein BSLG_001953 [Batrachochytrium salamandrivorans]|nr:hypothetical protein BSLG_001953 [Batrachochytrium salamandrivorans]